MPIHMSYATIVESFIRIGQEVAEIFEHVHAHSIRQTLPHVEPTCGVANKLSQAISYHMFFLVLILSLYDCKQYIYWYLLCSHDFIK